MVEKIGVNVSTVYGRSGSVCAGGDGRRAGHSRNGEDPLTSWDSGKSGLVRPIQTRTRRRCTEHPDVLDTACLVVRGGSELNPCSSTTRTRSIFTLSRRRVATRTGAEVYPKYKRHGRTSTLFFRTRGRARPVWASSSS